MAIVQRSFDIPYREPLTEQGGFISRAWEWFFRDLWERLFTLGFEQSFNLANNQSFAADIVGMRFDKSGVSAAWVDYLIQRVTTGNDAVELIQAGAFVASYNPASEDWDLTEIGTPGPDAAGVTLSITEDGQGQYQTSNITGAPFISRIVWRARTLAGKHSLYSQVGSR